MFLIGLAYISVKLAVVVCWLACLKAFLLEPLRLVFLVARWLIGLEPLPTVTVMLAVRYGLGYRQIPVNSRLLGVVRLLFVHLLPVLSIQLLVVLANQFRFDCSPSNQTVSENLGRSGLVLPEFLLAVDASPQWHLAFCPLVL